MFITTKYNMLIFGVSPLFEATKQHWNKHAVFYLEKRAHSYKRHTKPDK